jgi:Rieske Fe-S protein
MTLGNLAGTSTAKASVSGGASVTFNVTGTPDVPSDIIPVSGNTQAALVASGIAQPLTVKVADRFGNVRSGVIVMWSKVAGNGSVNVVSSVTNQGGLASTGANVGSPAGATVIRAVPAGGLDTTAFQVFAVNCAHLGCPVRWFPQSGLFMCPCHGGAYYRDGSRASGPPERGLFEYPHKVEKGLITIHAGEMPTPGPGASLMRKATPCACVASDHLEQCTASRPFREARGCAPPTGAL